MEPELASVHTLAPFDTTSIEQTDPAALASELGRLTQSLKDNAAVINAVLQKDALAAQPRSLDADSASLTSRIQHFSRQSLYKYLALLAAVFLFLSTVVWTVL